MVQFLNHNFEHILIVTNLLFPALVLRFGLRVGTANRNHRVTWRASCCLEGPNTNFHHRSWAAEGAANTVEYIYMYAYI